MTSTTADHPADHPDLRLAARMKRNSLATLPVPIAIGAVMLALVGTPPLVATLLGAAGWLLALALRQPVALVAIKTTSPERTGAIVGWFSGPAEELVRLALVLVVIRSVDEALWAGFGWAAIEVLLVLVNGFALAALMTKTDAQSVEARRLLAAQGMLRDARAVWGVLERVSATAMHVGFTLMLFAEPWLVLVTLPLHSIANMAMVRYAKRSLPVAEGSFALVGAVVLAVGLVLTLG